MCLFVTLGIKMKPNVSSVTPESAVTSSHLRSEYKFLPVFQMHVHLMEFVRVETRPTISDISNDQIDTP